jgi:anti-sigma B factor antagonist
VRIPNFERAVIVLPDEIDAANSKQIGDTLAAAAQRGLPILVADMTFTTFIDSSGIRVVLQAYRVMRASGTELRFVIPAPHVLRTLAITGVDRMLPIYPSLGAALTKTPAGP